MVNLKIVTTVIGPTVNFDLKNQMPLTDVQKLICQRKFYNRFPLIRVATSRLTIQATDTMLWTL